tara:strand:- start:7162 stop:7299 length:138 start_codon:yes stop_codon:yes gene_type:complete
MRTKDGICVFLLLLLIYLVMKPTVEGLASVKRINRSSSTLVGGYR